MQISDTRDEGQLVRELFQRAKALVFIGQFVLSVFWLIIFWLVSNSTAEAACKGPVWLFGTLGRYYYIALAAWNILSFAVGRYLVRRARLAQINADQSENQQNQEAQQNQLRPPRWVYKTWRAFNFCLILLWIYSVCANISRSMCSGQPLGILSLFYMIHPLCIGICSVCGCAVYLTFSETGRSLSESRLRRFGGGMPYQSVEQNQQLPPV